MDGNYNLNAEKKDLWKMDITQLREKLVGLRREKMELETKMYINSGTSNYMRNYPPQPEKTSYGCLKIIKKRIAIVSTILKSKLSGF